ncbi:MAG TPA: hypothetical protein VIS49_06470 [Cyclobacteriaceae bacterium]
MNAYIAWRRIMNFENLKKILLLLVILLGLSIHSQAQPPSPCSSPNPPPSCTGGRGPCDGANPPAWCSTVPIDASLLVIIGAIGGAILVHRRAKPRYE